MAAAVAIGCECGIVMMVPGIGTVAIASVLGVPLGRMLVFGLVVLVPTVVIASIVVGAIEAPLAEGFRESGLILVLTGVGGSLAEAISRSGLGDVLGGLFSADTALPLATVWLTAAVLHVAVGSVTISAITAAGVLAPVAPAIGLDPVLIALAAGTGALFAVHVTSNTFWLLQSLLGQSVRGALKTVSFGVSVASVVGLGMTLALSTVL